MHIYLHACVQATHPWDYVNFTGRRILGLKNCEMWVQTQSPTEWCFSKKNGSIFPQWETIVKIKYLFLECPFSLVVVVFLRLIFHSLKTVNLKQSQKEVLRKAFKELCSFFCSSKYAEPIRNKPVNDSCHWFNYKKINFSET